MPIRLRILIADDEPPARHRLRHLLENLPDVEILAEASNGQETLDLVQSHDPDLLILDIHMPDINGLRVITAIDDPPAVIFSTAHQEHAVAAFDLEAADYLLKPYSAQRLARAIERARNRLGLNTTPRGTTRISVERGLGNELLEPEEIALIRIDSGVVFLHHREGERYTSAESLKDLESRLPSEIFLRSSRQAIVNINEVRNWESTPDGGLLLRLRGTETETVSRRRARHFRDRFQG